MRPPVETRDGTPDEEREEQPSDHRGKVDFLTIR
jgi:hypothetical protein